MPTVDLVYSLDCPNVAAARENLLQGFARAGLAPRWREHRIGDPDAPAHVRGFGSPTVLVDGKDVVGDQPVAETCCRLYDGNRHAPGVEAITRALRAAAGSRDTTIHDT